MPLSCSQWLSSPTRCSHARRSAPLGLTNSAKSGLELSSALQTHGTASTRNVEFAAVSSLYPQIPTTSKRRLRPPRQNGSIRKFTIRVFCTCSSSPFPEGGYVRSQAIIINMRSKVCRCYYKRTALHYSVSKTVFIYIFRKYVVLGNYSSFTHHDN